VACSERATTRWGRQWPASRSGDRRASRHVRDRADEIHRVRGAGPQDSPDKGIHVAQPTPEELCDVAEVRMPLETMAALRLAQDPHGPAMDGVREALRVHLVAIESGDDLEAHVTHLALHKAIWDLADSPTLRKIWPLVGSQIHVALTVDQAVRHDPERDATMHRRLIRVIEEGDEATIAAEVEEHIRHSVDEVLRRLT
jgi:DNA-binding GntR family transcriptional regulator